MKPTPQQLEIAARWCFLNGGLDGEAESCKIVSKWLYEQATIEYNKAVVKSVSKETGVPSKVIRKLIKEKKIGTK